MPPGGVKAEHRLVTGHVVTEQEQDSGSTLLSLGECPCSCPWLAVWETVPCLTVATCAGPAHLCWTLPLAQLLRMELHRVHLTRRPQPSGPCRAIMDHHPLPYVFVERQRRRPEVSDMVLICHCTLVTSIFLAV